MPCLAVVKFAAKSGVPKDSVVNTFCFDADPTDVGERSSVRTLLEAFYLTVPTGATHDINSLLSETVSKVANAAEIAYYDLQPAVLSGGPMGSPVARSYFTPDNTGSVGGLPSEVAVCLSFKADYAGDPERIPMPPTGPEGDDRPRARLRGRVFIGPLNSTAMESAPTTAVPVPSVRMINSAWRAGSDLMTGSAAAGVPWCVWSRTNGAIQPVVGGWVDNAFDTQRRRGEKATSRTAF